LRSEKKKEEKEKERSLHSKRADEAICFRLESESESGRDDRGERRMWEREGEGKE